mmetsp:Transcript_2706/g.4102  ORF Transcript_2706/g.4102 Transcript_2706/m.4102 type:complete len:95 (+) Transcript_2706:65-349(+)
MRQNNAPFPGIARMLSSIAMFGYSGVTASARATMRIPLSNNYLATVAPLDHNCMCITSSRRRNRSVASIRPEPGRLSQPTRLQCSIHRKRWQNI